MAISLWEISMVTKTKAKATSKSAAKSPTKPKIAPKIVAKAAPPKAPLKVQAKAVANQKEDAPEKEGAEGTPDSPLPLLDLSDAEVKKMIKLAKKRGYVTHEEINAVMPSEEVTSDQIEDVFAMLNEMGINVVENDEQDNEEAEADDDTDDDTDNELVEAKPKAIAKAEKAEPGERTDDPV